jgi:hypothetical protein
VSLTDPVPEMRSYACPRCRLEVSEPWYGPCTACRTELRSAYAAEARSVTVVDYQPKMNVTPNAVATKD